MYQILVKFSFYNLSTLWQSAHRSIPLCCVTMLGPLHRNTHVFCFLDVSFQTLADRYTGTVCTALHDVSVTKWRCIRRDALQTGTPIRAVNEIGYMKTNDTVVCTLHCITHHRHRRADTSNYKHTRQILHTNNQPDGGRCAACSVIIGHQSSPTATANWHTVYCVHCTGQAIERKQKKLNLQSAFETK